jgi:hypothetical protein
LSMRNGKGRYRIGFWCIKNLCWPVFRLGNEDLLAVFYIAPSEPQAGERRGITRTPLTFSASLKHNVSWAKGGTFRHGMIAYANTQYHAFSGSVELHELGARGSRLVHVPVITRSRSGRSWPEIRRARSLFPNMTSVASDHGYVTKLLPYLSDP